MSSRNEGADQQELGGKSFDELRQKSGNMVTRLGALFDIWHIDTFARVLANGSAGES